MKLLDFLRDQAEMDFTGRLTMDLSSGRALVFMQKGEIIQAYHGRVDGMKALLRIFVDSSENDYYEQNYEDVTSRKMTIRENFDSIIQKMISAKSEYSELLEFIPERPEKVKVKNSIIESGTGLSLAEFDLLYSISRHENFEDIMDFVSDLDSEIMKNLISLKQKDAIE